MLTKLTAQAAEKFAAMGDEVEEAQNRVHSVQRRIGDLERQSRGKNPGAQADTVAPLDRDVSRQRARLDEAQNAFLAISRLHTSVRSWIVQLGPSVRLEDVEVELAKPPSGESYIDAVVRIRCEIENLLSERAMVRRAALSVEELKAESDAHVDALATRGRPPLRLDADNFSLGLDEKALSMAFWVWILADRVKERVRGEIEAQHERNIQNGVLILSAAERAKRLAAAEDLILAKERQEEWIIRKAEQEGTVIPRRDKADPLAILGLRVVAHSQARAA